MPERLPLTDIAHQGWAPYLHPGAWAIDATSGNGFDTEYLAHALSPGGRVFAIDLQESAVRETARRIESAGLLDVVTLIRGNHARMREILACGIRGQIDFICFNLGYLPNGDHDLTTRRETTLPALHEALLLLKPEGALSVIAYRGHSGAIEEADTVERFFTTLPPPWRCIAHQATGSEARPGPVWWMATGTES